MTNLQTTNHGLQRMSQRGLTVSDIDLIMAVGCEVPDGVLVRRKDCDEIERRLKEIIARVKRLEGKRLVVCDGRLVTAYHATPSEEHRLLRRDLNARRECVNRKH